MASSSDLERQQETLSVIQALADQTHRPFDDVNRIFVETFEKLDSDARIKDYLVVLTSKTVRDELRK
jgi:two-component sensor histidine kinase